jgi:purine-binding chemotaxis protein CheW
VYNLRGDIIPIIDLRSFFHLPQEKKKDGLENMLILRIEDRVYGTIVDKIDKVVGINSESIQPPHPIFGDINIKYINGVVEKEGDLYIILDVIRIFSQKEDDKEKAAETVPGVAGGAWQAQQVQQEAAIHNDSIIGFIRESLPGLVKFYPSDVNDEWIRRRYADWSATRAGDDLQLKDVAAAEEYISTFFSPGTGRFWNDDYITTVNSLLPNNTSGTIHAWNPGCGKGYETFSFACILKERYPRSQIKIWANDNDIMAISQAPNMVFDAEDVPEYCRAFMTKGRNGYSFNQELKDSIVFEYHDILNENPLPDLDFILIRDLLSFVSVEDQKRLIAGFAEKLKSGGMVFSGKNEVLSENEWQAVGKESVSAWVRL